MQMNPDDMIAGLSNFAEALETFAGDREILAEVLGVFSSEYPRQLAELRGAIDRKEPAAVRRCVHKIKSSVGTFGFHRAWDVAAKLETDGLSGDLSKAALEVEQLNAAVEAMCLSWRASGPNDGSITFGSCSEAVILRDWVLAQFCGTRTESMCAVSKTPGIIGS
jgi:HPt (histidine-containing phosphotransfer) domain-containing protein